MNRKEKMAKSGPGRSVPPALKKLLDLDVSLTNKFCMAVNKFMPFRSLKTHYMLLEISCHGILWLAGWLAFIWLINSRSLFQMQTNFYLGLIIDIVLVAVIKAAVRRRRPSTNQGDALGIWGPDIYGFPSGHASRASYIVYFFTRLFPLPIWCYPPMLAWSTSVCLSRVLLLRHHLLDIMAGVCLGLLEGCLVGFIWLGQGTSDYLLSWLTDDKLEGGEYHV